MVHSESGTETRLRYVSLTVQPFHGWSGQGDGCECVESWLGAIESVGTKLAVESVAVADDTALVTDSEEKFCRLVSPFGRVCERRKRRVNVGKSKVMRCSRNVDASRISVLLNGELLEEVQCSSTWALKWRRLN